jgi:hypothetical protein
MLKITLSALAAALLALGSLIPSPAEAQARVFVAAQGSDGNPCTFAARRRWRPRPDLRGRRLARLVATETQGCRGSLIVRLERRKPRPRRRGFCLPDV